MSITQSAPFQVQVINATANVISPTFDANGNVTDAWWAALPQNTIVEVAGTKLDQLRPQLPAGYVDPGTIGFRGINDAESGCAFDQATGKAYMTGGGHSDSAYNGMCLVELEKMRLTMPMLPSVYTSADNATQKAYLLSIGLVNATGYYDTAWLNGSTGFIDSWNDRQWTACHTYGDLTFVPPNFVVRGRTKAYWHYHTDTAKVEYIKPVAYSETKTSVLDPINNTVFSFGGPGYDYYTVRIYNPATQVEQTVKPNGMIAANWRMSTAVVGRNIFFMSFPNSGPAQAQLFNMDTRLPGPIKTITPAFPFSPVRGTAAYVPEIDRIITILGDASFWSINPNTMLPAPFPLGGQPLSTALWSFANGFHKRVFYYARRKCIVIFAATKENVRLIRMA